MTARHPWCKPGLALLTALVLLLPAAANAQLFRAYLSGEGSDANPCTLQLPCRLLPAAVAAVLGRDGAAGASARLQRPGLVASRVRARASAEGGVRRLAGRRRLGGRPIESLRSSGCPRPNAARGSRTKQSPNARRPRNAEASRGRSRIPHYRITAPIPSPRPPAT
jgi:hypothetical protein